MKVLKGEEYGVGHFSRVPAAENPHEPRQEKRFAGSECSHHRNYSYRDARIDVLHDLFEVVPVKRQRLALVHANEG